MPRSKQSKYSESKDAPDHCQHVNGNWCEHPETQRNINKCSHAMRVNKQREAPAIVCEREL